MPREGVSKLLHILQHALGRDEYGRQRYSRKFARAMAAWVGQTHPQHVAPILEPPSEDYRNHFCVGPGGTDFDTCRSAVDQGLMTEHPPRAISGGDHIFVVTAAGKAYVAANSPAPPKLTPAQRRYREWLDSADATGLSFGEWLHRGAAA